MPNSRVDSRLLEEPLTGAIIKAFYYVYNALGYGFLESIYSEAMARTLTRWGYDVQREVRVVIYLDGEALGLQRVDMIVNGRVIVENKSTYHLSQADHRQITSYVTGSELQVGLLLHFGPKPGFHRVICTRNPRRRFDPPNPPFPQ